MKKTSLAAVVFSLISLVGCANNDNNFNDTGYRNRDGGNITRINDRDADDNRPVRNFTRNVENEDVNFRGTNVNDRPGNNEEPRMEIADTAADKVAALPEVDQANVIVTDNNAYVAASLTNRANRELSQETERKIADTVKSVDGDIDNVYVSVNPDLFDRFNNYAEDIRQGRPVDGFFDEFSETIRRVFPTNQE
ncbi:YhcN/YlaJ family sporulation lipoprotein [Bacillaceae bacterium Marseille-Q3522]|nr:YhcN/YlaJ family sporulation lipoprotein [Bacillaceae bacterium Marseille-Q3522]